MVERDRWGEWLDPRVGGELSLLVPAAPGSLQAHPVATLVSNVRNNGPELVEPLPLEEALVMIKPVLRSVTTPYGEGRLHVRRATSPIATLLLSHGAGRGVDAPDLMALAGALPQQGVSVMLFEQPWHVAGRKVATPPPTLDAGLVAAADALRGRTPLVVGGRSAGARSGARCAKGLGARGVLALSFPLHPPGQPEKTRVEELRGAGLPIAGRAGRARPDGPTRGVPCRRPRPRHGHRPRG